MLVILGWSGICGWIHTASSVVTLWSMQQECPLVWIQCPGNTVLLDRLGGVRDGPRGTSTKQGGISGNDQCFLLREPARISDPKKARSNTKKIACTICAARGARSPKPMTAAIKVQTRSMLAKRNMRSYVH